MMIDWSPIRAQFARFGALRAQPPGAWKGDIPLPEALAAFYEQVGPWGETYYENVGPVGITLSETQVSFPALHRLWDLQAGYRWDGVTGERVPDWQPGWLVIADRAADPFIYDMQTGKILFAEHGMGSWKPVEIAPNLETLTAALCTVADVFETAGENLRDDDWVLRPEHRIRALAQLAAVLGDAGDAESFFEILER
ncbi:hypothetical protein MXL91_25570 [Achromobacter ruhlandii]|uniref:hypothetical protein n=1 Tax=Achromobacter ruhlandii TaxID=72557 RepID=UPI002DBCBF41|nr:hypothetical protein [Achromobacter ruhlandii]MEB6664846.1 hypothetical protein [Achromobacter ruhlandii]